MKPCPCGCGSFLVPGFNDCQCSSLPLEKARLVEAAPELLEAAKAMDALMENLWKAVPWGRTYDLDAAALNTAPSMLKRAIAKAEGKP